MEWGEGVTTKSPAPFSDCGGRLTWHVLKFMKWFTKKESILLCIAFF